MAPALDDPELKYAAVILVDGRPVVLFGGHLGLYHYVFQARRQVGSVSKLFFYDAVWQMGICPKRCVNVWRVHRTTPATIIVAYGRLWHTTKV